MADYTLSARIVGDSSSLNKSVDTAKSKLESFSKKMDSISNKFNDIGKKNDARINFTNNFSR